MRGLLFALAIVFSFKTSLASGWQESDYGCHLILKSTAANRTVLDQNLSDLVLSVEAIRFRKQTAVKSYDVVRYEPKDQSYHFLMSQPEVKHEEISPGNVFFRRPGFQLTFTTYTQAELDRAHTRVLAVVAGIQEKLQGNKDLALTTVEKINCR